MKRGCVEAMGWAVPGPVRPPQREAWWLLAWFLSWAWSSWALLTHCLTVTGQTLDDAASVAAGAEAWRFGDFT